MARTSLRTRITALEVGENFKAPKDYEETTVRNNAAKYGTALGRKFSVTKDLNTRVLTVSRIA